MAQAVDRAGFEVWNEEMVRQFDPDAYHNHPSPIVRFIEKRRVTELLRLLDVRPGNRVLEVGCGSGNVLDRIEGGELHGLDISDSMVARAAARLGDRGRIVKGDAEHLPFPNQHFDRVFCSEVLEHVLDPMAVMAEMRRVVAHNGVVAVSLPNEGLINRAKDVARRLGPVGRSLLGSGKGGYESVERMEDAWHLHSFDQALLRRIAVPFFHVERVVGIPAGLAPLRFAARLIPR